MRITPMKISSSASSLMQREVISSFGGVNYSTDPTLVDINRSPDMLNMQLDSIGIIEKVFGYQKAFPTFLGNSPVYHLSFNPVANKFVISYNGNLYTFTEGNAPTLLYAGVAQASMKSFFMNNKQYFIDGTNYLQWDGTGAVVTVESVAYVPTLTLGRTPTGGGTINEPFNLLTPSFKDSFSGNGSATAFTLSLSGLDAAAVTAVVNGVNKVETTDFTVNRSTGIVTFTVAPTTGTNNVIIQAAKTISGNANKIKNCKFFVVFGGQNDTRVFMSGNPSFKNFDFRSNVYDPTYFADTWYTKIGSDATAIKGYSKQYSTCLVFKEDSNVDSTVYIRSFQINTDGTVSFPLVQGNAGIGVIASDSIQIVEDSPVFLSKNGVYRFNGGSVKDERSMQRLSDFVEPNILNETNLNNATSFDFDGKYGVCLNGRVYVFDYRNKFAVNNELKYEAYLWDSINASCFYEYNNTLYFADSTKGMVYRFNKRNETNFLYQNDGQPINAYWYSKIFNFGADNYKKLVNKVDFTLKPLSARSSAKLYYKTNKKEETFAKESRIVIFDFNDIDFGDFDFNLSTLPQPSGKKVKAKKIIYFQLAFKNNNLGEGMSINSVTLEYLLQSPIR